MKPTPPPAPPARRWFDTRVVGEGLLERCERLQVENDQLRRTLAAALVQSEERLAAFNTLRRSQ